MFQIVARTYFKGNKKDRNTKGYFRFLAAPAMNHRGMNKKSKIKKNNLSRIFPKGKCAKLI
jgi:hypothetical protein